MTPAGAVMSVDPPSVVALRVAPSAEARIRFICQALSVIVERLSDGREAQGLLRRAQVLIHDGEPFAAAEGWVRAVRSSHPTLPIVLFVRVTNGVTAVLLAASKVSDVIAVEQGADEGPRLVSILNRLLCSRHEVAVAQDLAQLCPDLRDRPRRFLVAALKSRARREPCSVASVAREIGCTARRVLDTWPRAALPRPKSCLDWVTLLYVARVHEATGASWESIAHAIGVDGSYLRRLRHRYFPSHGASLRYGDVVQAFRSASGAACYRR
jgi:hypothetical protein